jgi:PAS domain-containing protein
LKNGFNKIFSETLNQNRIINELLTLEYGEVANMQRLQAAHALFAALEYTNDPVEIMNDNFKLLVIILSLFLFIYKSNFLFKYVNNAFEKLTGYSLEEITGKDFSDLHRSDVTVRTIKEQMIKGNVSGNKPNN